MQKCKSLRIHVKKRSYNNINYCKENVTGNVIKDSTRTPMTGIQVRVCEVCDPVIFTSLSHAAGGGRSVHSGYRTGRGTTAHIVPLGQGGRGRGDIRWRGEAAAAQIDFYHDTLTIVN